MKRAILLTIAIGAAVLMAPAPASAFNFPNCGVFNMIGLNFLTFESSTNFTSIKGSALVLNPTTGFIKTGQNNTFNILMAHRIEMQNGSKANLCLADVIDGNLAGCLATGPLVVPPGCTAQPFPPGLVVPLIPSLCLPGTDIVIVGTQTLAPGCYKSLKVLLDSDLTLDAGALYLVKGEFRTQNRGHVQSDTPGTRATIVSGGQTVTGVDVEWKDLFVFQLATTTMQIFNDNLLDNVVAAAPNAIIHFHTGSVLQGGGALAAKSLDVQPVLFLDEPPVVCECPTGFQFQFPCTTPTCDATTARACVPVQ